MGDALGVSRVVRAKCAYRCRIMSDDRKINTRCECMLCDGDASSPELFYIHDHLMAWYASERCLREVWCTGDGRRKAGEQIGANNAWTCRRDKRVTPSHDADNCKTCNSESNGLLRAVTTDKWELELTQSLSNTPISAETGLKPRDDFQRAAGSIRFGASTVAQNTSQKFPAWILWY